VLPGVDAAVCAASLCAASPRVWCSAWCCCSPQRCLPVRNLSFLACWSETLFAVVLVLPHPSPPRLVSLPVCLCRVALFFLTLGRVGRRPLLCAQHPQVFCAPSLYSLLKGFCALEVLVSTGKVVLEPVLAHQSLLWLTLLLSWLAPSLSCLRVWLLFW
jgi:hypothetical protein